MRDPSEVVAPKAHITAVHVIYNGGPGSCSVAELSWDGEPGIGMRWNGDGGRGIGNPQSRGQPTWFLVPEPFSTDVKRRAEQLAAEQEGGALEDYRAMAADSARETEAWEWSEGLIGDAADAEG
jgi:hypothetical protein